MALQDKLKDSKLSLEGNGFNPVTGEVSFGYTNPLLAGKKGSDGEGVNILQPDLSILHNTYSQDNVPPKDKIQIVDFNKTKYKSYLPDESKLDELDLRAPKNERAGKPKSVVSQIYKSKKGSKYEELGPGDGFYHKEY
jgi:hypothetical protein